MPVELEKQKWCSKPGWFPIKHQRTTWAPFNCFALKNLWGVTCPMAALTRVISIINLLIGRGTKICIIAWQHVIRQFLFFFFLIAWKAAVNGKREESSRENGKQTKKRGVTCRCYASLVSTPLCHWLDINVTHISITFPRRDNHEGTTAKAIKSSVRTYYSIWKRMNFPAIRSLKKNITFD